MYFYILLFVHCTLCLSLVFLVLLQQGKGADAGATFGGGGGSNSVLGVSGAADFITKLTTSLAIAFMVTSIFLVRGYQDRGVLTQATVADPLAGSVMNEAIVEQVTKKEVSAPAATQKAESETKEAPKEAASSGKVEEEKK